MYTVYPVPSRVSKCNFETSGNHEKFEASAVLNLGQEVTSGSKLFVAKMFPCLHPLRAAIHTQETDNSSRK